MCRINAFKHSYAVKCGNRLTLACWGLRVGPSVCGIHYGYCAWRLFLEQCITITIMNSTSGCSFRCGKTDPVQFEGRSKKRAFPPVKMGVLQAAFLFSGIGLLKEKLPQKRKICINVFRQSLFKPLLKQTGSVFALQF